MSDSDEDMATQVVEGLFGFVDSVVVPLETANVHILEDWRLATDERGAHSEAVQGLMAQVREASAEAGYYSMFVPEDAGGGGLSSYILYRVWEALHHRYGGGRILPYASVAHWSYGPSVLCRYLSPQSAEEVLGSLMSGRRTVCFGMSEPDAGSDALAMRTRAVRDGDEWVITGTKQWTTNSPTADYIFVFAVTNEELRRQRKGGISGFLVPVGPGGANVMSVIRMFGQPVGDEGIVNFDEVRVPSHALVGELDKGFALAMAGVNTGRLYNAGRCVGMARWALDKSVEYALQRSTFGKPIIEHQGISFQLADCATEVYAGDAMARDCARRLDSGEAGVTEVNMVKLFTTEMATRVIDRCMQVHGAMGLTNEMKLYDAWHQARLARIADGSSEILRRSIVGDLKRKG
jgi:acyl-CoA dehydrogenase